MATKAGEAYLELTAKNAKLKAKLKESEKASKSFITRTGAALRKFGKVAFIGAIAGFAALTAVMLKATKAAAAEELQTAQLAHQIGRLGIESEDAMRQVNALATEQQKLTRFGDTVTRATLSQMIMLTNDYAGSMKNLALVFDIAESGMFDVKTAARYVSFAMQGNIEILGRYIAELKTSVTPALKTMSAHEKAAFAIDLLRQKFGGLAKQMGTTTAGAWAKMTNAISDAWEALGKGGLDIASEQLENLSEMILRLEPVLIKLGASAGKAASKLLLWAGRFVEMIDWASTGIREWVDSDIAAAHEQEKAYNIRTAQLQNMMKMVKAEKRADAEADKRTEERRERNRKTAIKNFKKHQQQKKDLEIEFLRATGYEIRASILEIQKKRDADLVKYKDNAAARVMVEKIAQAKIKKLHQSAAADIIDLRRTLYDALDRMKQLEENRMGMLRGRITAPLTAGGMRLAGGAAAPGVAARAREVLLLQSIDGHLENIEETREPARAGGH